jgi:hypothetical protein
MGLQDTCTTSFHSTHTPYRSLLVVLTRSIFSVSESTWTGGGQDYSDLNEGGAYWFDGLVATAFVSGDSRLLGQVQSFLDYIIANQGSFFFLTPRNPLFIVLPSVGRLARS